MKPLNKYWTQKYRMFHYKTIEQSRNRWLGAWNLMKDFQNTDIVMQ